MKFIVADDHEAYRAGLTHILRNGFADCEIIEAGSYDELFTIASIHNDAHLCIVDLNMPGKPKSDVVKAVCSGMEPLPIVIISGDYNNEQVREVVNSGGSGILLKTLSNKQIELAIRLILSGEKYIPSELIEAADDKPSAQSHVDSLPNRQKQVFDGILDGKSNKEIALDLDISLSTVKNHIALIMRRLDVGNRHEMIIKYKSST